MALLTNLPTAYREPFYDRIDALLRRDGGALTVVYGARWAPDRQWAPGEAPFGRARSVVLPRAFVRIRGRQVYVNPLAAGAIARSRPDVVIVPAFAPWNYAVAAWCRAARVPYLVWNGETPQSARDSPMRRRTRRMLLAGAHGYLAYGPAAAEYLAGYGIARELVAVVGNGIDMDAFARRAEAAAQRRQLTRERFGLSGPTVLSVGGKGLDVVAPAIDRSELARHVLVAGRDEVAEPIRGLVSLGRIPAREMPDLYAAADCLIHPPAYDQWPHAVNEALSAGLPVVATPGTGVPDEVFSGPGCSLVARDPEALGAAVDAALRVRAWESARTRDAIRAPMRPWGVNGMAARWVEASARAIERQRG